MKNSTGVRKTWQQQAEAWREKEAQRQTALQQAEEELERAKSNYFQEVEEAARVIRHVVAKTDKWTRGSLPEELEWAFHLDEHAHLKLLSCEWHGELELVRRRKRDRRWDHCTYPVAFRYVRASTWEVASHTRALLSKSTQAYYEDQKNKLLEEEERLQKERELLAQEEERWLARQQKLRATKASKRRSASERGGGEEGQ